VKLDPIITFTSDFGTADYYVGAVKGAILNVAPRARIVDLSHEVTPHDPQDGAFLLLGAYALFPEGTIHLIVVDPGVGSSRRGLAVSTHRHTFIAPDNGVLGLILEREDVRLVVSLEEQRSFRDEVSPTFHGRDVFGPVAGLIASGTSVRSLGPQIDDPVPLSLPSVFAAGERELQGAVLHIDHFGNIITNVTPAAISALIGPGVAPREFRLGQATISSSVQCYSEITGEKPCFLLGSLDFYEIALAGQSAAVRLGTAKGDPVTLTV
jgi:S-adenosylmethionine hydrolase